MIESILISEAVSESLSILKKTLSNSEIKVVVNKSDLLESLYSHSKYILNYTNFISFKELRGNKKLNETYIDLDLELQAVRFKEKNQKNDRFSIQTIINNAETHLIILGGPGAGKTTTVKKICQLLLFEEYHTKYKFPILINLRDLSKEQGIYQRLKNILGLNIYLNNSSDKKQTLLEDYELMIKFVNTYLDNLNVVLILDGLDEVNPTKLKKYNQEIKTLMHNLRYSLVILTSRSASFNISIQNSVEYEICNLNKRQINEFVHKWFQDKYQAKQFLTELSSSKFYDLSLKPISLAHLCAIYERTKKFYDKPKSIYKKLVRILIEEWDEQREIVRESGYSDFDNERKFDFLSHIAFDLTTRFEKKIYFEEDLKDSFSNINEYYNLPKNQCDKVIKEIEAHTGIIIQSSFQTFEFVHKSMQEYLAAEHMIKMPEIPIKLLYNVNISNELAITVALSSDPNSYFYKLVFDILLKNGFSNQFMIEFLSRLAYEKPDFKKSMLLPYTFAYIISKTFAEDFENYKTISKIISDFKEIHNVKISFKKFLFFINSYFENIADFENEKSYDLGEEFTELTKNTSESDKVDIFDGEEVIIEILNSKTFVNIELDNKFLESLTSNEIVFIEQPLELKIPKMIYKEHFQ